MWKQSRGKRVAHNPCNNQGDFKERPSFPQAFPAHQKFLFAIVRKILFSRICLNCILDYLAHFCKTFLPCSAEKKQFLHPLWNRIAPGIVSVRLKLQGMA